MVEGRQYDEELDSLPQVALAVDLAGNDGADESITE